MIESDNEIAGTVFDRMQLRDDTCFLCGTQLFTAKTVEHVFPRWLQRGHDLWNEELTLLNGTSIRYSQLTIPCCEACNTNHLSVLENRVRTAVQGGYEEMVKLSSLSVYQWFAKIFYGILRKELTLLMNRGDADGGTIVPKNLMEGFYTLHHSCPKTEFCRLTLAGVLERP